MSEAQRNAARVMRTYKALRVTGQVARLMRSQGMKAAGSVNPAILAVDAALAILDAGRAYFRLSTEREKTRHLENELKIARAQIVAEAASETNSIAVSLRNLKLESHADTAIMATFRLLDQAVNTLSKAISALAPQDGDPRRISLTRKYEIFMGRYLRAVEQMSLARASGQGV